jgi:NADH-quinone oxidoreductase subunit L
MFRLVFLTFHGERRHDAPRPEHAEEEPAAKAAHGATAVGHGGHLHDAPPAMALALVVLAIGSVAAGWIGIPHALGGHNQLHAWLEPVFTAPEGEGAEVEGAEVEGGEAALEAEAAGDEAHAALELGLMAVSSAVAVAGIALAWFVWIRRPRVADNMVREFPGLHRLLLNKYYVDEVYDAAIVQPIHAASREGLWRVFDVRVIDGAVNGAATVVQGGASVLRRLQTGSVRSYASSLFVGVLLILGYYLWR